MKAYIGEWATTSNPKKENPK